MVKSVVPKPLMSHDFCTIIRTHVSVHWTMLCFMLAFCSLPYGLHTVGCDTCCRVNKMKSVVHCTVLVANCCQLVVCLPHVRMDCSARQSLLLYTWQQCCSIPLWHRNQEPFLIDRIISSKTLLFRNNSATIIFTSRE